MQKLSFICFFLFSCILAVHAETSKEIKLSLNWKPEAEFGGFYTAELNGDYKKNDLNVKILEGGSGTPTVQLLANNKVDYAIVSAEEIVISNDKNPKNKVVALYAVYQTSPQIIMAHEERGFTSIKDVFQTDGLLALQSGLTYSKYLQTKFKPYKVKIVPYLGGITNFQKDPHFSQQGFLASEPILAQKAGLKVKSFLVAKEGYNPYTTVLATTEKKLKENPTEIQKLVQAVASGWEAYLKNPEPTNKHMYSLNKSMELMVMNASAEAQKELIVVPGVKVGEMNEKRWDELQKMLKDMKLISNLQEPKTYFHASGN